MSQVSRSEELLMAVAVHEQAVWAQDATTGSIDLRNDAARTAIAAGWTSEEIARAVHVKPEDVQRWAAKAAQARS